MTDLRVGDLIYFDGGGHGPDLYKPIYFMVIRIEEDEVSLFFHNKITTRTLKVVLAVLRGNYHTLIQRLIESPVESPDLAPSRSTSQAVIL